MTVYPTNHQLIFNITTVKQLVPPFRATMPPNKSNEQTTTLTQQSKQLTKLTVLMLTMLTVLIYMPATSTAASLFDATKMSSSSSSSATSAPPGTATVLAHTSSVLSNSESAVLQQLAESAISGQRGRRKRLRKRHNANIRLSELAGGVNEVTAEAAVAAPLEWVNTCGGHEVMPRRSRATRVGNKKQVRKQLILLTKSLRYENSTLNSLHKIIIDDMHSWRLYGKKYRFLPSLNRTAKIELRHWHRDMQKFVASFAELGIKQYRWDQAKRQHTSELTRELNSLLLSAKRVLCEVENALNTTYPAQVKLPTITSEEMQKKLKFYSKDDKRVAERGVDQIDLKYAKQRYSKYIQHMFHILRRRLRAPRKVAVGARATAKLLRSSSSSSSSSNSAENSSQWAAIAQVLDDNYADDAEETELKDSEILAQVGSGASTELTSPSRVARA